MIGFAYNEYCDDCADCRKNQNNDDNCSASVATALDTQSLGLTNVIQ